MLVVIRGGNYHVYIIHVILIAYENNMIINEPLGGLLACHLSKVYGGDRRPVS